MLRRFRISSLVVAALAFGLSNSNAGATGSQPRTHGTAPPCRKPSSTFIPLRDIGKWDGVFGPIPSSEPECPVDPCEPTSRHFTYRPTGTDGDGNDLTGKARQNEYRAQLRDEEFSDAFACGERLAREGQRARANGRYREALRIEKTRSWISSGSKDVDRAQIGVSMFRYGLRSEALDIWRALLRSHPGESSIYIDRAYASGSIVAECRHVGPGVDLNPQFLDTGASALLAAAMERCIASDFHEAKFLLHRSRIASGIFHRAMLLYADIEAATGCASCARASWLELIANPETAPGSPSLSSEQLSAMKRLIG